MAGEDAPGWDSIDAAIRPLVGDVTPSHFGTPATMLPNQGGLWGISAYDLGSHWFLVTYGLSELFQKVSDDLSVSGWGEELTMHAAPATDVPMWAVQLLGRLGTLVYERSTPFLPGGLLEFPGAVPPLPPVVCWTEAGDLGVIDTPNGSVQFVQTVGISEDDLDMMRTESTEAVLDRRRSTDPLLVWPRA